MERRNRGLPKGTALLEDNVLEDLLLSVYKPKRLEDLSLDELYIKRSEYLKSLQDCKNYKYDKQLPHNTPWHETILFKIDRLIKEKLHVKE